MAAVSLFWNTNMAAVTSYENALYYCLMGVSSKLRPQTSDPKTHLSPATPRVARPSEVESHVVSY